MIENKMLTEEQIEEQLSEEVLNDAIYFALQGEDQVFFEYFIEGMNQEDLMMKFDLTEAEYEKKIDNFRGIWQKLLDEKLASVKINMV